MDYAHLEKQAYRVLLEEQYERAIFGHVLPPSVKWNTWMQSIELPVCPMWMQLYFLPNWPRSESIEFEMYFNWETWLKGLVK